MPPPSPPAPPTEFEVEQARVLRREAAMSMPAIVGIDLETTGFTATLGGIVEVGCAILHPNIPYPHGTAQFSMRCNPGYPITPAATAVHGIKDADVADAMPQALALEHLLAWIHSCVTGNAPFVQFWGHNANFENRFLEAGWSGWKQPVEDTVALAKRVLPGLDSYKLTELAGVVPIPIPDHTAEGDALSVACLAFGLGKMAEEQGL